MKSVFITLFLAFGLVAALSEQEYQDAFVQWTHEHQKSYRHDEFRARYQTFRSNLDFVNQHNADSSKGFQVAMNKFGDLTNQEFARIYNGLRMQEPIFEEPEFVPTSPDAPSSMNWNEKGAVTPIKNQGQCGSCWSFSTTGSTEGCHFLTKGQLIGLSEKNLMDCSWSYGNQGCNGGLMTSAMKYIIANNGIDTESSYPYVPESSHNCQFNPSNVAAKLTTFHNVPAGNEQALLESNTKGPVSVAIDASHSSFQFYSSGVYYEPDCSSTALDHGVLAAGWGVDNGQDYWLVKNSWGADWGLQGYIWMSRNRNNNCGIATTATLPSC